MGVHYYLLGGTPVLPYLTQNAVAAIYFTALGAPIAWFIAKAKLAPLWIEHRAHQLRVEDLLDANTPDGLGEISAQLDRLQKTVDELKPR